MQRPLLAATAFALCATSLGGCTDLGRASALRLPPVNPESPVAAQVQAAADRDYAYPRFSDVPSKPKDLPTVGQIKGQVVNLVQRRRRQETWVAENPPMTSDTSGFVAATETNIPAAVREPVATDQQARSEAAAAALRAAVEPPPQIAEGAPPATPAPPAYIPAPAHSPPLPPAVAPAKGKKKPKVKLPPPPASAPSRRPG